MSCFSILTSFLPIHALPAAAVREALRARVGRGHHPPRGALHQEEDGAEPHLPGEWVRNVSVQSGVDLNPPDILNRQPRFQYSFFAN